MKTFKNSGGQHTTLDGRLVEQGQTVTCEEDLAKMFPTKFSEVVVLPEANTVPDPTPPREQKAAPNTTPHTGDSDSDSAGDGYTDTTAEFPGAAEAGLVVKRNALGFWVYDGAKEPAHDKPLKKAGVTKFIKEYTEEV